MWLLMRELINMFYRDIVLDYVYEMEKDQSNYIYSHLDDPGKIAFKPY